MGYRFKDRVIHRIAVIGSGNIGPDIALYFVKVLHTHGVRVVVVDVATQALDRGRAKFEQKIAKGREAGAFTPEAGEAMLTGTTFTTDYQQLGGTDLVVEAATESFETKREIFAALERTVMEQKGLFYNLVQIQSQFARLDGVVGCSVGCPIVRVAQRLPALARLDPGH